MKKFKVILLVAAILLVAGTANAQNYPTKPVRMIVPFGPGGASDVVARIMSPGLIKELGQQIVVDNRSGASGNIGVEAAAHSPADGYTLLLGNIDTMSVNPSLFPKFPVSPMRDFIAVTQVVDAPLGLLIHPSIPVKTIKEFIEYAKARPGELNFGTAGPASPGRLNMELFMDIAGINLVHVAYKGGAGAAAIGLLSGEVPCGVLSLASILTHVNAGKLRLLGVAASKRWAGLPDVPTISELGLEYSNITTGNWQGVYVPAGTPKLIVDKLYAVITKVISDQKVIKLLYDSGIGVVTSKSPEEFAAFTKAENQKWAKKVKESGMK